MVRVSMCLGDLCLPDPEIPDQGEVGSVASPGTWRPTRCPPEVRAVSSGAGAGEGTWEPCVGGQVGASVFPLYICRAVCWGVFKGAPEAEEAWGRVDGACVVEGDQPSPGRPPWPQHLNWAASRHSSTLGRWERW